MVIKGYLLLQAEGGAPTAFSCSMHPLRKYHFGSGATQRLGKCLPRERTASSTVRSQEHQTTGKGTCAGLLLSNERSRDARRPPSGGSRDGRVAGGRISLPRGFVGALAGRIQEPPGAASASLQPWAASRWEVGSWLGSSPRRSFPSISKVIEA